MTRAPGQYLAQIGGLPPIRSAGPEVVQRDPGDASVGMGNFTQGVPAFWFARSTEYGTAENLYYPYGDSPYVRDAIRKIAQPISSCELVFSRPTTKSVRQARRGTKLVSTSRGLVYRSPDELVDLPQVAAWLREPVKDLTYHDFVEASIGWLKLQECFWCLPDNSQVPFPEVRAPGSLAPIRILAPNYMRPVLEDNEIVSWTYTGAGRVANFTPDQVVRLRGWNPYNEHRGLGDYRAAHLAAEADWLAGKFSRNLMANNGDTSRIISVKGGQPTDAQREQLLREFKARREASLRGINRDVVVGGDVELHTAQLASVDAAYISQRLENRHEIFIAFGVPPSMADIKASYSIGSASDMFQLLINTCIPTGAKFCAALERLVKKMTGQDVEIGLNWDEHPCMQEVRKERLDSIAKLAAQGMPMEQINEYLALGLVEFPGWDLGYLPINVQPVLDPSGEVAATVQPSEFNEPESDGPAGPLDDGSDNGQSGSDPDVKAMLAALHGRCHGAAKPVQRANSKGKAIWEAHMRLRSAAVKQYRAKTGKVLTEYRALALKRLSAFANKSITTRSLVDVLFDAALFGQDLKKHLDPVHRQVLQRAGDELFDEIGQPDDPWKMAPATVQQFLSTRSKLVEKVGETVQAQINTTLTEGIDKGETTDQLAARVKAVFNNLAKYEAVRIAMTETAAAYGFARHQAMSDAGIEYKSWLSSHGGNVRPAHAAAESDYAHNPIPVDEPFLVDGEELMYPGDPSGSPGNVINCHCIQLAVQPEPPNED